MWRRLLAVSLTTFFATMACATATRLAQRLPLGEATATPALAPTSATAPASRERQLQVLDAIAAAVRDEYIHQDFDGVDWEAAVAQARQTIEGGVSEEAFAQTLRDLAAKLPRGAAFYTTRAERIENETRDTSTYQGIGVFYGFRETPEPRVVVLSVIKDAPAQKAGLNPHDAIYAVDGQPIKAEERDTIQNRIRGPAASQVTLTVQSPGQNRREVTITRGQITSGDPLRGAVLSDTGLMYYRFPVAAPADLADTLAQDLESTAGQQTLTGLILDLRVASGQGSWPLAQLLTLFGDGDLGELYTRAESTPLQITGLDKGGSQTLPLVILVGPDTRGFPEVFATLLQAAKRATVIGLPSPGETEIVTDIPLSDGSVLSLATGSFKLPDGADPGATGVKPDISVDQDWDAYAEDNDPVLDQAVALLKK